MSQALADAFTHKAVDPGLYNDLKTPADCARFQVMVQEYIAYVELLQLVNEQERQTARVFVKMVNNDIAWPLARDSVQHLAEARQVFLMLCALRII